MSMRSFFQRHARWGPPLVALLVALFPVFGHLDALPIHMWDESRLANNALEMALGLNPHPLVPTFDGLPEMWNTKPPLLIWMQAGAIRAFGPGELSVRLPSALAALATGALLYHFCARRLGRPWLGTAAVAVLMTTTGYVSIHGIRTGDYDSLLTFFTTAYGLAWFAYLEDPAKKKWFYLTILALTGAAMTKGVAGLLATPTLVIYALIRGRFLQLLKSPHTYIGLLAFVAVVAAYYLGRERVNAGYIDAVKYNELGRYSETIEGHVHKWAMYYISLLHPRFQHWIGWWAAGIVLAFWQRDEKLRRANLFAVLFCGIHLAVISSAGTRIEWYDLPVFPYAAITAACGLYLLFGLLRQAVNAQALEWRAPRWVPAVLPLVFFIPAYGAVYDYVANHRLHPWDSFEDIAFGTRMKATVEGRMPPVADVYVWEGYRPSLDYYIRVMRSQGIAAQHVENLDSIQVGQRIAASHPEVRDAIKARFAADSVTAFMDRVRVFDVRGIRDSTVRVR